MKIDLIERRVKDLCSSFNFERIDQYTSDEVLAYFSRVNDLFKEVSDTEYQLEFQAKKQMEELEEMERVLLSKYSVTSLEEIEKKEKELRENLSFLVGEIENFIGENEHGSL